MERIIEQDIVYNEFFNHHAFWDCAVLDVYEKTMYMTLLRFASTWNRTGRFSIFPSYGRLSKALGISRPKTINTIKQLENLGIVEKIVQKKESGKRQTSNTYVIYADNRLWDAKNRAEMHRIAMNIKKELVPSRQTKTQAQIQ